MSDGGKGSAPRPIGVNKETFSSNWDAIFSNKKETTKEIIKNINSISDKNDSLILFAVIIIPNNIVYLVNANSEESAIEIINGNGYKGFSESVNDYKVIQLAQSRSGAAIGLEPYNKNIHELIVSQISDFINSPDNRIFNIYGLDFEFKYSNINYQNYDFNKQDHVDTHTFTFR
jgi:hypothetical protein